MRSRTTYRLRPVSPTTAEVRALNDTLRRHNIGGRTLLTRGIAALPTDDVATILWAVSKFDAFDAKIDPAGDHSFAYLEARGHQIFFKIEGGGNELMGDSETIEDARVMTIMLVDEY